MTFIPRLSWGYALASLVSTLVLASASNGSPSSHVLLAIQPVDAVEPRHNKGVLDNAWGVATVLEIAKAFKKLPEPPHRSVRS